MSTKRVHSARPAALAVAAAALLAACNQGRVTNAAPRLDANVPMQRGSGGQMFSLDLGPFVSDRESDDGALMFTVVAGGGSFVGTTYSNTFETLGRYRVTVRVSDPLGKFVDVAFDVDVKTANLAVLQSGDDLDLLDTDTNAVRGVADGSGFPVTHEATLGRGWVVYERAVGASDYDLFAYDANTTATVELGASASVTRFALTMGTDRVLFTETGSGKTMLKVFDVRTGSATTIADVDGEAARNPMLTAGGLVAFEVTSGGQGDIWAWEPLTNTLIEVSASPRAEVLRGVLADGGLVFSRVGDGGEQDLHYWAQATGVVEIGASMPSLANLSKTFAGGNAASRVAFEVLDGAQTDLYLWNPSNGNTTAMGATADDETFRSFTGQGHAIFEVDVGGSDRNLVLFDTALLVARAFPASAVDDTWQANLSDGRVVLLRAEASGTHLFLASYDGTTVSEVAIASTASVDYALAKVLVNDKVVFTDTTNGAISLWNPTGPTTTPMGATTAFAGELPTAGDFAFTTTASSQTDLWLWDESASAMVSVASGPTSEALAAGLADGRVLFTQVVNGTAVRELWVRDVVGATDTQVTSAGVDTTVLTTFAADNS